MSLPLRTAAQLWVFLFIVFLGAESVMSIPEARTAAQVLYGVPVIALATVRLSRAFDRLDAAVLATTLVYAAVCFLSPDRSASVETLGLATAFGALFILMRQVSVEDRRWLATAAATALAFNLVLQAVLWIREKAAWIAAGGGVPRLESFDVFVWSSANAIPVMALVAVAFIAWAPPGPVRRLLWISTGAAAAITVPLSVGRSGWLGIGVAVAVGLVLFAPAHRRRAVALGLSGAAAAVAGAVIAFAVIRNESLFRLLQGRDLVWAEALAAVGQHPWFGVGPGTYSWARLAIDAPYAARLPVRLTHNAPLQTAVDGGLVLLVACAGLIVVWLIHASRRGISDRAAKVGLAVLAGYAAVSLFDDSSYLPSLTACTVAIAAWLVGPAPRYPGRARLVAAAPAVLLGLALVSVPVVVANGNARSAARDARDAAVAGDWQAAADAYGLAAAANPTNPSYRLGHGFALANVGAEAAAREAYLEAIRLAPGDSRGHGAMAVLEPGRAGEWLDRAASRTITEPQYLVRLGVSLLAEDDREGATLAFARAVTRSSRLYRPLLDQLGNADLRAAVTDVLARGPIDAAAADALTWDMGLADGDLPADAHPAWLAVAAARDGDERLALAFLDAAVADAPHDAQTYEAILAVDRLTCAQLDRTPNPEALLRLLRPPAEPDPAVRVLWDQVYREPGLGEYQPVADPTELEAWPWPLLGAVDECRQP